MYIASASHRSSYSSGHAVFYHQIFASHIVTGPIEQDLRGSSPHAVLPIKSVCGQRKCAYRTTRVGLATPAFRSRLRHLIPRLELFYKYFRCDVSIFLLSPARQDDISSTGAFIAKWPTLLIKKVSRFSTHADKICLCIDFPRILRGPHLCRRSCRQQQHEREHHDLYKFFSQCPGTCCNDFLDIRRSPPRRCTIAINLLPESVIPSLFHTQGPDDPFRLPRTVQYQNCRVIVSLYNRPELSSWHRISYSAAQVVSSCTVHQSRSTL